MVRHAPVGGPSSRRGELLDQARAEPCSADVAARECRRRHPFHYPADPARPAIPRNAAAGPLRAPRSETGFALPVPDGMLLVTAGRVRIPGGGRLPIWAVPDLADHDVRPGF